MKELQHYSKTKINLNFSFTEEFCKGNNCLKLFFRNVTVGEYCLQFGKIGICKPGNKCGISKIKQIYPTLRSLPSNNENTKATPNNMIFKYFFMPIILLYHYFCNTFDRHVF